MTFFRTHEECVMRHPIRLIAGLLLLMALAFAAFAQQEDPAAIPTKPAADKLEAASLLAQSDKLWENRATAGNDKKSVVAAEKALAAGADEFEAYWRMARGCFWVAEQATSAKDKIISGERGWREGQKAAELRPDRVEGWFWGVVALGQYSEGIGIAKAFFQGIAGKFETMNQKALELDKSYSFGGPPRSYGRYWQKVPWPKKDLARAETLMQQSIKLYPKKLRSHFYLAEIYLDQEKPELAKQSLETCLALDPRQEEFADGVIFRKQCEKLMAEKFPKNP
jgi:tetratricopeptide (TPR) repeat protein